MEEKIIGILTELRPEFNFSDQVDFIEEGYLDSFDIINLVTSLDETFGISIDGMDIVPENFNTVANIVSLTQKNSAK